MELAEPQKKDRINWIDEFKGFILLSVCLFHVEQIFKNIDIGMVHASSFRMTAFFFISGVLFSTRRFPDFKSYFFHKTKVLLFPYLLLSLLFMLLDPVVYDFSLFSKAPKMSVMNIYPVIHSSWDYVYWNVAKIFVAGKSSIGSGPLWFVFTLYSISVLFYLVQKILPQKTYKKNIGISLVVVASFIAGWILSRNHVRLPLGLERDLTTLAFFSLGFLSKNAIKWLQRMRVALLLPLSIICFAVYAFFENSTPYFSIMNNDLGKSVVDFALSSVLGIAGLVSAFILFSQLQEALDWHLAKKILALFMGILRNVSRNALVVLPFHWWVLLVIRLVFKPYLDQPYLAYVVIPIVAISVILAIPLFRNRLYFLLQKEKISVKESLSIK